MKKIEQKYLELLQQDRRDNQEIIKDLIRINERICMELKEIIRRWQEEQKVDKKESK